jgi:excisionase family DNA binding protein
MEKVGKEPSDHPLKMLTVKQTAQRLGVSGDTVRRMAHDGRIGSVRIGSRTFVPEEEVARLWLAARRPHHRRKRAAAEALEWAAKTLADLPGGLSMDVIPARFVEPTMRVLQRAVDNPAALTLAEVQAARESVEEGRLWSTARLGSFDELQPLHDQVLAHLDRLAAERQRPRPRE